MCDSWTDRERGRGAFLTKEIPRAVSYYSGTRSGCKADTPCAVRQR